MSFFKPAFRHPEAPVNELGFTKKNYEGSISTLCAGCGHDSISAAITQAIFELSIPPHNIAKMSGIGCSSKTPTYFLGNSHGFNTVHGRMPSVATGANMANREMIYVGVSGDGDTASIGMGQFSHAVRRNVNMMYIVENNGCYGLTKGQDSATADVGSKSKKGEPNPFEAIDLASVALQLGATFVARSFSGDKAQLIPLIKAAISHRGFAFIDVISPCVTFNNNPGSTRGYEYVRDHLEASGAIDFVPLRKELSASYALGHSEEVTLHDGSVINLHKADQGLDVHNRRSALKLIKDYKARDKILTGLLYMDEGSRDCHETIGSNQKALSKLKQTDLGPGNTALQTINDSLR
jgi:2-oxoglutarate ferredoxin oxidoreductase subunit beta